MEKIYSYNIGKLVRRLIPPRWRSQFNVSWFETLLSGLNYSQVRFNNFKNQALIELSYNGQTIYLEKMLNDRFDSVHRRIIISHGNDGNEFWYNESEMETPNYLRNESESGTTSGYTESFIFNEGENSTGLPDGVDFRVIAPSSLSDDEPRMRKEIDKYKMAGKQYDFLFT